VNATAKLEFYFGFPKSFAKKSGKSVVLFVFLREYVYLCIK